MTGISALYIFLLAGVAGYVLIARVPSILHTPLLSGSNFIHGIVLAGSILALGQAETTMQQVIGFIAVTAASANVVGGFVVTDRMLALFNFRTMRREAKRRRALESAEDTSGEFVASEDRRVQQPVNGWTKR